MTGWMGNGRYLACRLGEVRRICGIWRWLLLVDLTLRSFISQQLLVSARVWERVKILLRANFTGENLEWSSRSKHGTCSFSGYHSFLSVLFHPGCPTDQAAWPRCLSFHGRTIGWVCEVPLAWSMLCFVTQLSQVLVCSLDVESAHRVLDASSELIILP